MWTAGTLQAKLKKLQLSRGEWGVSVIVARLALLHMRNSFDLHIIGTRGFHHTSNTYLQDHIGSSRFK
jgi:hypothetical protein